VKLKEVNIDRLGTSTSLLCAIHCAVLPLFISLGYVNVASWLSNPLLELVILGFTGYFLYKSIIKNYLETKANPSSFYLAITGILLIILHYLVPTNNTIWIVLGGLCLAASHFIKLLTVNKAH